MEGIELDVANIFTILWTGATIAVQDIILVSEYFGIDNRLQLGVIRAIKDLERYANNFSVEEQERKMKHANKKAKGN